MHDKEEIISAEDLFGAVGRRNRASSRSFGKHRETKAVDLFKEAKTRMVMRIYGVSRAKALEIIASRVDGGKAPESEDCRANPGCNDDDLMSAEEFFGG